MCGSIIGIPTLLNDVARQTGPFGDIAERPVQT
jgi:hypothetical protein